MKKKKSQNLVIYGVAPWAGAKILKFGNFIFEITLKIA